MELGTTGRGGVGWLIQKLSVCVVAAPGLSVLTKEVESDGFYPDIIRDCQKQKKGLGASDNQC